LTEAQGYLERLAGRRARHLLRSQIVFGLLVSSLMLLVGSVNYFLVVGAKDVLWKGIMIFGAGGVILTVVFPSAWSLPERTVRRLSRAIGNFVFVILLTLIYFVLFWPVGKLMRVSKGSHPIYAWKSDPPDGMEGWTPKETIVMLADLSGSRRALRMMVLPMIVLGFFIRRRHFVLVPVLVVLVILGLLLFFVQSSALAPFIYTLF